MSGREISSAFWATLWVEATTFHCANSIVTRWVIRHPPGWGIGGVGGVIVKKNLGYGGQSESSTMPVEDVWDRILQQVSYSNPSSSARWTASRLLWTFSLP
jgi:hypothetical protein